MAKLVCAKCQSERTWGVPIPSQLAPYSNLCSDCTLALIVEHLFGKIGWTPKDETALADEEAPPQKPGGGWAPGHYRNRCVACDEWFLGDKRAVRCPSCAAGEVPLRDPDADCDGPYVAGPSVHRDCAGNGWYRCRECARAVLDGEDE